MMQSSKMPLACINTRLPALSQAHLRSGHRSPLVRLHAVIIALGLQVLVKGQQVLA